MNGGDDPFSGALSLPSLVDPEFATVGAFDYLGLSPLEQADHNGRALVVPAGHPAGTSSKLAHAAHMDQDEDKPATGKKMAGQKHAQPDSKTDKNGQPKKKRKQVRANAIARISRFRAEQCALKAAMSESIGQTLVKTWLT